MARRRTALLTLVTTSALIVAVAGSSARALASASAAPALSSSAPALVHGALFNGAEIVPNQVIVRFAAGTSSAGRRAAVRAEGAAIAEPLSLPRTELVELADGTSVEDAIAAFEENPDVTYAEPNYVSQLSAIPNDTNFAQLWGLNQVSDKDIDAPEAWDLTTGNSSIIVAVIDSGVAYDHPDLAANIWTNDDPAGGGDQDGNGFVDDTNGWDFVSNDNAPLDANEHGTHVAGTIGARGNNALGVTGVNWQASIMPLRAGNASGSLTDAAIIDAIVYACANGARVVNGSFGGGGFSQATLNAIDSVACANTLFVFAAGNGGSDGIGDNNDTTPEYPCNYNTTRIVCVAATDQNDARAFFSNFGATNVDLAAPGVGIFSSMPTFVNVLSDGFEDTPTLFNTRWGGQTAPAGHPLWGPQNFVYAGGGAFSLSDSPAGNYSANTDTHIRSLTGSNLSGRAGCSLGYNMHLATEPLLDGVTIEASTAFAGTYTDVSQGGWSGTTGPFFFGFQEDLGAFDGQASVFLRFRLRSNGTNQFDGAHIDDISLNCVTTPSAPGNYQNLTGTSMAAPHVAGAAALVLARNPALTTAQVRTILLSTVDPIAGLSVASGGRLNVGSAVAAVDVVAPQTTIDTGPSGPTNDSTPTFTFSSSEPGTFQCRVDASVFAACTSPHTTAVLADGAHTFEVRATDLAANTDPTPASRTFTVDTAVQTQIDSGPSGLTNDSTPTFALLERARSDLRVPRGYRKLRRLHLAAHHLGTAWTIRTPSTSAQPTWTATPTRPLRPGRSRSTPRPRKRRSTRAPPAPPTTPRRPSRSRARPERPSNAAATREPFAACTSPHTTSILGEGAAHLRRPRDRPGRQHRPDPREPVVHGRHRRPNADRLGPLRPDQRLHADLHLLQRGRGDLPMPHRRRPLRRLQLATHHLDPGRRSPHLRGARDRPGRQHRPHPGEPVGHGGHDAAPDPSDRRPRRHGRHDERHLRVLQRSRRVLRVPPRRDGLRRVRVPGRLHGARPGRALVPGAGYGYGRQHLGRRLPRVERGHDGAEHDDHGWTAGKDDEQDRDAHVQVH